MTSSDSQPTGALTPFGVKPPRSDTGTPNNLFAPGADNPYLQAVLDQSAAMGEAAQAALQLKLMQLFNMVTEGSKQVAAAAQITAVIDGMMNGEQNTPAPSGARALGSGSATSDYGLDDAARDAGLDPDDENVRKLASIIYGLRQDGTHEIKGSRGRYRAEPKGSSSGSPLPIHAPTSGIPISGVPITPAPQGPYPPAPATQNPPSPTGQTYASTTYQPTTRPAAQSATAPAPAPAPQAQSSRWGRLLRGGDNSSAS